MKYEMIFGDEGLFFDAQQDCEMVGNGHHKVENGKLMVWNFSEKYWAESHTNKITIAAMRRIIKEPKRWTLEDKKAGRLPEVGAKCSHCHSIDERNVLSVTDKYVGIECDNSDMNPYFVTHAEFIQYYIPIETSAEKAQREEDEFFFSLKDEWQNPKSPPISSASFEVGVRAAYRKLKGGE